MARRLVREQHQFVAPFAQREEQRAKDRDEQQPVADGHVDDDGARRRAQHESDRDRQDVDDDDVLERSGVAREQREVRGREEPELGAQ